MKRRPPMLKRVTLSTLAVLLLAAAVLAAPQYVASVNKEPFHRISCRWAQKISPKNAVYYNTREEAIQDGHRPCKVCKP